MSRQARLLAALLGLWGGAFAWSQSVRPEQRRVAKLTFTRDAARTAPDTPFVWPESVVRAEDRIVRRDLFASREPIARAVVSPTPRPTPVPPAVRYIGFVSEGGTRRVFLSGSAGVMTVAEGDLLPNGWRVETIEAERLILKSIVDDARVEIGRGR